MADSRVIGDYGGPFVDAKPVKNPQSEVAAAKFNRLAEDGVHFSRTSDRVQVDFVCTSTAAPVAVSASNVTVDSHWGSGDSQKPTVEKTATGLYTITFAASYSDALGTSQSVVLRRGHASVTTNTNDDDVAKVKSVASNVITVAVFRAGALSDLGGTGVVSVFLR